MLSRKLLVLFVLLLALMMAAMLLCFLSQQLKFPQVGLAGAGGQLAFSNQSYSNSSNRRSRGWYTRNTSCWLSPSRFPAWRAGVVTKLTPVIERNCTKLIKGDKLERWMVKERLASWKNAASDQELLQNSRNCVWVQEYFNENLYTTNLEKSFPIAFNFLIHNSPQQVVRLLRYLYRPHNTYCIHPDKKSNETFKQIFYNIASCLSNIIIPEALIAVRWAEHTIMDAQMLCLKKLLLQRPKQPERLKWRYVINLCGKEFPLATTHEIVSKLTKLNGSSSYVVFDTKSDYESMRRLKGKKIPHNFHYYKSMTYGAISYKFAYFLFTNTIPQQLNLFFQRCYMPEEHFYATVYMIPGVPGGYNPKLKDLYFDVDHYIWLNTPENRGKYCGGINVHSICVSSVAELKEIVRETRDGQTHIFHNKYFMDVDHVVMDCAEEKMVARNWLEYLEDCPLVYKTRAIKFNN